MQYQFSNKQLLLYKLHTAEKAAIHLQIVVETRISLKWKMVRHKQVHFPISPSSY